MFNSASSLQFVISTQFSHGVDAWQSWTDRYFASTQELILGVLDIFAYSAGVIAAVVWFAILWAAEVLLATNAYCVPNVPFTTAIAPVSVPVSQDVTLDSLDVFDTFAALTVGLNSYSFIDAEALALTTY